MTRLSARLALKATAQLLAVIVALGVMLVSQASKAEASTVAVTRPSTEVYFLPDAPPADCTANFAITSKSYSSGYSHFKLVATSMTEWLGTGSGVLYYGVTDLTISKTLLNTNGNISGRGPNVYTIDVKVPQGHHLLVSGSVYIGNYEACAFSLYTTA